MTLIWLRRLSLLVILAALAPALAVLWRQQPARWTVDARVLHIDGNPQLLRPGGPPLALRSLEALASPCRLTLPQGAKTALSLVPGITVLLTGETQLDILETRMRKRGEVVEERLARVRSDGGAARFLVGAPADRRVELRVSTAACEIVSVPGTLFSVTGPAEEGLRLTCARGAIHWSDPRSGRAGWLLAGNFQEYRQKAWNAPGAAGADPEALNELLELLSAGERLREWQKNLRAVKPGRSLAGD